MRETLAKDYIARYQCVCGNCLAYRYLESHFKPDPIVEVYCPGNPGHHEMVQLRTL